MKKMYGLISKVLLVVIFVTQIAGMKGFERVDAATYGSNTRVSQINVNGGYFDTGVIINQDYSIEMIFSVSDVAQYKNYYEAMAGSQRVFRLRNEVGKGLYAAYGWYNGNVYTMKANQEMVVSQKKNITYINNSQVQKATVQTLQATSSLRFGDFKGYIKNFKIWDANNTLIANYIPVVDSNGKACMYDIVKGKTIYYTGQCQAGETVQEGNTETDDVVTEEKETDTSTSTSTSDLPTGSTSTNSNISFVDALTLNGGSFDSGVKVNLNYSLEVVFSLSKLNQYKNVYESLNNKSKVFCLRNESTDGFRIAYGWYQGKKLYQPKVDEKITVLQKKNTTYINENQVQKATVQTLEATDTLKFGDYYGTIESFRIWNESDKLVAEFLPALDSSKKACMYDTVNKKYVYYSGTCTAVVEEEDVEEDVETEEDVVIDKEESIQGDIVIESPTYGSASSPSYSTSGSTGSTTSGAEDSVTSGLSENGKKVYEILAQLMKNYDSTRMDVSAYKVTYNEFYSKIVPLIEEEYYWEYYLCYNIYPIANISGSYITTCWIENIDDNFATRRNNVKNSINEFLAGIDSKMTDLDKVLWAHEYVVNRTKYTQSTFACGSASGVLGDGYAMCTGYAEAMQLLLHYVEIETAQLGSGAMNHTWLAVRLDGSWYHIDPTWDDTKQGANGKYSHRYLIRSDKEFQNNLGHYNWKYIDDEQVCSSDKFTSWFVHDVSGTMYYYNGLWYYINSVDNSIKCADIYGTTVETVVSGGSSTLKLVGITGKQLIYTLNGIQTSLTLQ